MNPYSFRGHAVVVALAIIVAVLVSSSAAMAGPARLRIAIPAIFDRDSGENERIDDFTRIVGLQIRERVRDCDSIEVVSQSRCDAIMGELTSRMRQVRTDRLLNEFREFQDVDLVVYYRWTPENLIEVWLLSASDPKQTSFDAKVDPGQPWPLVPNAQKAVATIAQMLPISAHDRQVMSEVVIPDPNRYLAVYRSRYNTEASSTSQYQLAMKSLLQHWDPEVDHHQLSVAALRVANQLFQGGRTAGDRPIEVTPAWLQENASARWVVMTRSCFQDVLGTADEAEAYPLARVAPQLFADEVIQLAKPLLLDEAMDIGKDVGKPKAPGLDLPGEGRDFDPMKGGVPRSRRLGALRVLGLLGRPDANALIAKALSDNSPEVREAAALSAGALPANAGAAMLRPLLKDTNPRLAFAAAAGLWRMRATPDGLVNSARLFVDDRTRLSDDAILVLADLGGQAEIPLLQKLASERRRPLPLIIAALQRLGAATDKHRLEWLCDIDEGVIQAELSESDDLAKNLLLRPRIESLANDPFAPLANRARFLLSRHRPADPGQAMAQELATEHPYIREQILEKLARNADEVSVRMLESACGNRDAYVRVKAMQLLVRHDASKARPHIAKALADSHAWVRFHAAALAPALATPEMVPAIKLALEQPDHTATGLYLEEALSKARGAPAPEAPEQARSILGKRNLTWCTNPGLYAADSPFDAYYCMDTADGSYPQIKNMHLAHEAGKILFARALPIRVPARLILDPAAREEFVLRLDNELNDEVTRIIDGVIYGEETMEFPTDALWPDAWRLFCRDAGLDAAKVNGKLENLNPFERQAWGDWIHRIHIRGFNMLYDLTKLRQGKLRPGLQVGSFQACWPTCKFDFAGIYDYKGDSRLCAYDLVRHFKTLFPDKPVLWLSLGIGGYEMNPVYSTQQVPAGPMFDTYDRAWSDSLTAWIAGAQNGWFSVWFFMKPSKGTAKGGLEGLRGRSVWVEDIRHDSPVLADAIDYAHEDQRTYEPPVIMPKLPGNTGLDTKEEPAEQLLEDPDAKSKAGQEALNASLARHKEKMTAGFLFYQQYVYDCARIFASLPRQEYRTPILVNRNGVDVWTRPGPYPLVAAHALLNRYDFIWGFNQIPLLDLNQYRLLVTHDPQPLTDETIRAVSRWLKTNPGLLVVHHNLTTDKNAQASTVEEHDGRLKEAWPWEKDVRVIMGGSAPKANSGPVDVLFGNRNQRLKNGAVGSCFEVAGANATSLATVDGRTVLAIWSDPAFKGAVLFDGMQFVSEEYLDAIRDIINDLHRTRQIGVPIEGPALLETLNTDSIKAAASSIYHNDIKGAMSMPGMDVMSAALNAEVGRTRGSTSALTLRQHVGRFVAASESLTALSERPFAEARIDGDSLILKSAGVVRVGSASGGVAITTLDGKALPVVKIADGGKDKDASPMGDRSLAHWLFQSQEEGVCLLRNGQLCYFRSRATVRARPEPDHAPSKSSPPGGDGARGKGN